MEQIITKDDLTCFTRDVLIASGAESTEAHTVAQILVWSDLIGRSNYGVWRLPILSKRLEKGLYNSPCKIEVIKNSPALKLIDADKGMGHYIAYTAMEQAIELAKKSAIAFVGVNSSNFFGAGAYYVHQAAANGMIGIAASNSFPKVAAYNGVSPVLGTNPFAFSAPRKNKHHLLLDMATSASAGSTIRKNIERGEELPEGIAVDKEGNYIKDPNEVINGTILPFGGAKGYGLSLMVEILCGIITNAGYSHEVKSMYNNLNESGNNGHFFIAIDIKQLLPLDTYYERMENLVLWLQETATDKNTNPVLLPGEIRWMHYNKNIQEGIKLDLITYKSLAQLARHYNLKFP